MRNQMLAPVLFLLFNIYNTVDVEKYKNGGTTFLFSEATSTIEPIHSSVRNVLNGLYHFVFSFQ